MPVSEKDKSGKPHEDKKQKEKEETPAQKPSTTGENVDTKFCICTVQFYYVLLLK